MQRLKELRKQNKLTMKKLGNYLGLGESTICMYEKGEREPDQKTLAKLADYFGVSIDYLLGRDETPAPPLDDVKIALYNAADGLSEQGQKDLIDYIQFLKTKDEKNKK